MGKLYLSRKYIAKLKQNAPANVEGEGFPVDLQEFSPVLQVIQYGL